MQTLGSVTYAGETAVGVTLAGGAAQSERATSATSIASGIGYAASIALRVLDPAAQHDLDGTLHPGVIGGDGHL
ncbi:hypothetical protein [Nocardia sp. SYP-A9097]|uniref:hypothetical protein n=1 Tax=Nocardia sp. SYP-A9097 TaxID=2663237 RepID=UPI00129B8EF0|nr:hypothetical protein [Nocardia sp. SYP-A9097]